MIRPVDYAPNQLYGENPTRYMAWDSWLIQTFGNYQPDGHTGEDYPCPAGTPVRAVTSGTVRHVGRFGGSYADNPWWIAPSFAGFTYVVDHGWFIGIYGHCMDGAARVRAGQQVTEGQVLGLSGNTGASTGDHLHFEALPDGYILNSYMYGRMNPATLFGASLVSSGTVTPGTTTTLKEWDEMATPEQIRAEVRAAIFDAAKQGDVGRMLGYFNWVETPLPGWNGNVSAAARVAGTDQAVNDIRAQLGSLHGQVAGLVGALAAVNKGEPFDEGKLLEGVKAAAESGVKNAIESITVTVKGE